MKLTTDREADALYLDLDEAPAAESEEISQDAEDRINVYNIIVAIFRFSRIFSLRTHSIVFVSARVWLCAWVSFTVQVYVLRYHSLWLW